MDKWQSLWKTRGPVRFFPLRVPPYMGDGFDSNRHRENNFSPPSLWIVCGQVMQILSTSGEYLDGVNRPNIQRRIGYILPDMVVLDSYPQFPQALRLILNHEF